MSENTDLPYYQKSCDVVLSKAKDYYKNNKDRLKEYQKNYRETKKSQNIIIIK